MIFELSCLYYENRRNRCYDRALQIIEIEKYIHYFYKFSRTKQNYCEFIKLSIHFFLNYAYNFKKAKIYANNDMNQNIGKSHSNFNFEVEYQTKSCRDIVSWKSKAYWKTPSVFFLNFNSSSCSILATNSPNLRVSEETTYFLGHSKKKILKKLKFSIRLQIWIFFWFYDLYFCGSNVIITYNFA